MNQQQFFMGIDISKGYADFVIINATKQVVMRNFQLDDTRDGHTQLHNLLITFFDEHPSVELFVGLESTGAYENNWMNFFLKKSSEFTLHIARLNPLPIKKHGQSMMHRNINDRISAIIIADYLATHFALIKFNQQDKFIVVRKQAKLLATFLKQETHLRNQLESLVYASNTELLLYCKDNTPQWILHLLLKYPTANTLARAQEKSLMRIPFIRTNNIPKIIQAAKQSVASETDEASAQLIIQIITSLFSLQKTIQKQTQVLKKHCPKNILDLLQSFPGIGETSAILLFLHIGDVGRFRSSKHLASYFGVHPVYKESGDGSWKYAMSKKGRAEVRGILFMIAMVASVHNPLIKELHKKNKDRGMAPLASLGICMHKILRIVYGMLKNNAPFDPEIDKNNQTKYVRNHSRPRKNTNRRYQSFDDYAPISRRQTQKRKEQKSVPNATQALCAGSC